MLGMLIVVQVYGAPSLFGGYTGNGKKGASLCTTACIKTGTREYLVSLACRQVPERPCKCQIVVGGQALIVGSQPKRCNEHPASHGGGIRDRFEDPSTRKQRENEQRGRSKTRRLSKRRWVEVEMLRCVGLCRTAQALTWRCAVPAQDKYMPGAP